MSGHRYILALRSRQQVEGELALDLAQLAGLPRPRDVTVEWQWREVDAVAGLRHVVVYSASKARHDFEVRDRRLRRALDELCRLQVQAERDKLSARRIVPPPRSTNLQSASTTQHGFKKPLLRASSASQPAPGEMVVYGSSYGLFGHIATVVAVAPGRYEVIEQNFLDFSPNLEPHWQTFDPRSVAWPDAAVVGFIDAPPLG